MKGELRVEDSFHSFQEAETAVKRLEKRHFITYNRRDSRTFATVAKRVNIKQPNATLPYYEMKYIFVRDGKEYHSKGFGRR